MPRRPLTELQMQLIERARNHGSGTIYAISPEAHAMAQAFEDGRTEPQPEPKPTSLADLDIEAIYRRWNAPRRPAQTEDR